MILPQSGYPCLVSLFLAFVFGGASLEAAPKITFRWLGVLPGAEQSSAYAVSADGSMVQGRVFPAFASGGVITTSVGGKPLSSIPVIPVGEEAGVSGTTQKVARLRPAKARSSSLILPEQAFRWTRNAGMIGLGIPWAPDFGVAIEKIGLLDPLGAGTVPLAASADKSIVVGYAYAAGGLQQAFRWTIANGIRSLGYLSGISATALNAYPRSVANAISPDGSVIVGESSGPHGSEAFRWTSAGMIGLGDLPGGEFRSSATGVSADGRVIVGYGNGASGQESFVWDAVHGMRTLASLFKAAGLDGEMARSLSVKAISADGFTIVGSGGNEGHLEAWMADLPAPRPVVRVTRPHQRFSSNARISLKGTATSRISHVTYRIAGKTAARRAEGKSSWHFAPRLRPGRNVIFIQAHGPGGNSKSARVVVVRR